MRLSAARRPCPGDLRGGGAAGGIGTNQNSLLFGVPQMNVPSVLPGQPSLIPEIPLAKKTDQKGVAKIAVFAYNRRTGRPVWQSGVVQAESTSKDTWVLGAGPFRRGTLGEATDIRRAQVSIPLLSGKEGEKAAVAARAGGHPPGDLGRTGLRAAGPYHWPDACHGAGEGIPAFPSPPPPWSPPLRPELESRGHASQSGRRHDTSAVDATNPVPVVGARRSRRCEPGRRGEHDRAARRERRDASKGHEPSGGVGAPSRAWQAIGNRAANRPAGEKRANSPCGRRGNRVHPPLRGGSEPFAEAPVESCPSLLPVRPGCHDPPHFRGLCRARPPPTWAPRAPRRPRAVRLYRSGTNRPRRAKERPPRPGREGEAEGNPVAERLRSP